MARLMNSTTDWQRSSNLGWHQRLKVPANKEPREKAESHTKKREDREDCALGRYLKPALKAT